MSIKGSVKPKCLIKFLLFQGCVKKKTVGSHTKYTKTGILRSLTVRENDKEVPRLHIHTTLKTLGISKKVFYAWVKDNC